MMKRSFIAALLLTLNTPLAQAQTQGVSEAEIVIGGHNDLSGPFAAFGAPSVKAAQLYFDAVNAAGGVHGRKIRYVVEDHGYQVPKAVQAANKLINRDKIFAMVAALGTPHNLAALPLQEQKGIPNLLPVTGARQMIEAPIDLKFVGFASYYDTVRAAARYVAAENGRQTFCAMYIPSDFGREIQMAVVDEAAEAGLTYAAETTHRPDETDFVGSLSKLREEGCDLVGMAVSVRGTITALATAKKMGWTDVDFVGSAAAFHTVMAEVPGGVTDGFYVGAGWQDMKVLAATRPTTADWIARYEAATGEFPGQGAMLGQVAAETFVRAAEAAGPDLTVESLIAALEEVDYVDAVTGDRMTYGADHIGTSRIYISRIVDRAWKTLAMED